MAREYPKDEEIINAFLKTEEEYPDKGINWHLRITADRLNAPLSYVRGVLEEASERNEV